MNAEQGLDIEGLKVERDKLQADLRIAKRELAQRDRALIALENNFNIKMNMFRNLAAENEKHQVYLTHLMKNSVNYLVMVDSQLNIVYCSDSFLYKIGAKHFEVIEGKNILEIYNKFADDELFSQLSNKLAGAAEKDETTRHDIFTNIGNDVEKRVYRVTNTPMNDKSVNGMIINWQDITDITNAKNEAEHANRTKSNFLAAMSHEIRTPMNAIIGISQIQLQKRDLSYELSNALMRIYNSGNILLGIINDILDMSKIETGRLELTILEYNVPSLINDTVQLNIVRIGSKPLEFILDVDSNLPSKMLGDELRIKQILNNLLSNAIKYSEKGHVRLSVSHIERDGDIFLTFVVEDTGQGISAENHERLFSEYLRFDKKNTVEGTGLGLNITKNLVEIMGGSIEFESEYGKGSVFKVTIRQKPVKCDIIGVECSEQLRNFTFSGELQSKIHILREPMPYGKVLVVDDVETNLYVASGLLSLYGLKIETTLGGHAAIKKVEDGEVYDVIFMDHMMPLIDGIETTQKLRALGYDGTIIALTANALVGNNEMFSRHGFDGFISKPIDARNLNAVLNEFIRDKHPEEANKYKAIASETAPDGINSKLFEVFRLDAEKAITTLRETAANGDIKLFTITAHAMKSALANIGENEKSRMAFELEKAGRAGDMEFISGNAETFIEALGELVEKLRPAETAGSEEIREDMAFLVEQLMKISAACEEYDDTTAYSLIDLLKEKPWKTETFKMIDKIYNMLFFDSDFEGVVSLIAEHINTSVFKNYMEDIVFENIDGVMESAGCCRCDDCRRDVMAIALNQLIPAYYVSGTGALYLKIKRGTVQSLSDVVEAITRGADIVKKNPRKTSCLSK